MACFLYYLIWTISSGLSHLDYLIWTISSGLSHLVIDEQ
jgi:hypothetical protein